MKIKRYKKAEKIMSLYKNNFSFREPYQILLDGTFCQVALAHKVNIIDQLPKYLNGQCKLLTTACVVEETRRLGKPLNGAFQIVSQFPVHNCGHEKPLSASKCLSSFIIDTRNRDHYLIATQDHNLRTKVSSKVVCPVIKLANNALVLQPPTDKTKARVERTHDRLANGISRADQEKLEGMKEEGNDVKSLDVNEKIKRKRKGPKGVNPLACKKRSKKKSSPVKQRDAEKSVKKTRKRKKVHVASHVKSLLQDNKAKE